MTRFSSPSSNRPHATLFQIDKVLLLAVFFLTGIGLMALYSEGLNKPSGTFFYRQLNNIGIGLIPFLIFYKVNIAFWRKISILLYIFNIATLCLVFIASFDGGGNASRWISLGPISFQPSELSKILTILTLSTFYTHRLENIKKFSTFFLGFVHVFIPMFLIFKQPHLGATLVMLAIWFMISAYAGIPSKYLIGVLAVAVAILGMAFTIPGILKPYQKDRALARFKKDEQGSGYQQLKAMMALGVGGLTGTGYLQGQQKAGRYVPEQHNDFIFTVIGEEFGLLGSASVLLLFFTFLYRCWLILFKTNNPYLRMVVSGVLVIFIFHTLSNLLMNINMFPVAGLWLPFISYGGTAIWLCFGSVGLLLQSVLHDRSTIF